MASTTTDIQGVWLAMFSFPSLDLVAMQTNLPVQTVCSVCILRSKRQPLFYDNQRGWHSILNRFLALSIAHSASNICLPMHICLPSTSVQTSL